ncbi:MAG: tocopherol cyclase family protein [Bacillota bacterium]|nr:tocopherol cyclase family protein [Bacillota bacterium]
MNKYFKGWYFKIQNEHQTAALIPAMHIDGDSQKSCSIQIITKNSSWSILFPYDHFKCIGNRPKAKIGENIFSEKGISLNIQTEIISANGVLKFEDLTPLSYDIMGPFKYIPFMECRHSIFSMTHKVNGYLYINDEKYLFKNDVGYIEGDRGRSFPKSYAWTQCNFFYKTQNSIMLSVAEIPIGAIEFTGIIGEILWHGKSYRIATYLGARAIEIGNGMLVVKQGRLTFTSKLIKKQDKLLYAPVCGNMKRTIRESLSCTAYYQLEENGEKIFEFITDSASFEYEYDT